MADPKYVNLPGIAVDQPDVYESEDCLIQQDGILYEDKQSDAIEKLSVNIKDSYSKFQGYWLDSNKVDFSGNITSKNHIGYSAWNGPYELQAVGEKEDLIQKVNRLKCEMADLEQELAEKHLNKEESSNNSDGHLVKEVQMLRNQLLAMKINDAVGIPSQKSCIKQHASKKYFSELEDAFKKSSKSADIACATPQGNSGQVIYELQYNPNQIYFDSSSTSLQLMSRLDRLESILGASSKEKLERLTAETGRRNLLDVVNSMLLKVSLMDTSQLDLIETRLNMLHQKLNSIAEKSSSAEDQENISKVKAIYELVKKLEPLMISLPSVVDRLVSLKKLHEEAVNFNECIGNLENVQSQLEKVMATQTLLLADVQAGLRTNIETFAEAMKRLEERL